MRKIIFLAMILSTATIGRLQSQVADTTVESHQNLEHLRQIAFTPESASEYLTSITEEKTLWKPGEDSLRSAIKRLLDHYHEPFDSVKVRLASFPFVPSEAVYESVVRHDTLPLFWLNDSVFIVDTLGRRPFLLRKSYIIRDPDIPLNLQDADEAKLRSVINSIISNRDTIREVVFDEQYLASAGVVKYTLTGDSITPAIISMQRMQSADLLPDSTGIIISEPYSILVAGKESSFNILPGIDTPDSLRAAVEALLTYTYRRDSVLVYFSDPDGNRTPFWITDGKNEMYRYWVRNFRNDSITVWIGNPAKNDIALILEDDVNFRRPEKRRADELPIASIQPELKLLEASPLTEIPDFWKYGFSSSFSLNQNYLSNWAKGGESSIATMFDILGKAEYTKRVTKESWVSTGRIRYGSIRTKEKGFRTSNDIIELNSQYNKVMKERLDFSAVLYAKTQSAKGFNYPNDSVAVSKFLNPGAITLGVGVEYKPFKDVRLNLSPLSYRNTFVLDTANINQTLHGVEADKRSRQELGGQLLVRSSLSIFDGLDISNSLRLFSSYINNPQNIDVDWEVSMEKQINWYFSAKLNLHLIYDDDVRFPILDNEGKPVLWPDGTPRKAAKAQFKQFLGLTLSFRL